MKPKHSAVTYTITFPEGYEKVKLPGLTRWVEALRSGAYKQGSTYLKRLISDSSDECQYCCLGVLCEVEGIPSERVVATNNRLMWEYTFSNGGLASDSLLPSGIRQTLVLSGTGALPSGVSVTKSVHLSASGSPNMGTSVYESLAYLNDSGSFTFGDIADILEQVYCEADA